MQQHRALISRPYLLRSIERGLSESPAVILVGARQTGKTTLARLFTQKWRESPLHYFDLETSVDRSALSTPELSLGSLHGLVVIDEVQRIPALFSVLRPLLDRSSLPARFLLLGSASPNIIRGVSESLAGRILFVHVSGLALDEVGDENRQNRLWIRGGFPRSFLANDDSASQRWRESFISTFLERDIPLLGIRIHAEALRRFWLMLCHYHAQLFNASELSRSLAVSDKTARAYLNILSGAYVIRVLAPWHENIGKRQLKMPKVYIRDSGLLHSLLGIESIDELRHHPKYGASWEGFAVEQILIAAGEQNSFFWRTQRGAELDLLLIRHGKRFGFEFKCEDAPRMTKSIHTALADLRLSHVYVVYPGQKHYILHDRVEAMGLPEAIRIAQALKD